MDIHSLVVKLYHEPFSDLGLGSEASEVETTAACSIEANLKLRRRGVDGFPICSHAVAFKFVAYFLLCVVLSPHQNGFEGYRKGLAMTVMR